jgi:O-antigen/teichoic acid export membrane protein
VSVKDLRGKALRGGLAKALAQATALVLRIGAVAVLARILEPHEFGLVNMVTAVTGILTVLKDAGLSLATVQRATVTDEQLSTLFWLNVLAGAVLTAITLALAPGLAAFYREPRLIQVTAGLAPGFLLNGLGVQHSAILARQMRFTACAAIDIAAIALSAAVAVGMAAAGFGYWALVGMSLALPAATSAGAWIVSGWVPGRPRRTTGIASMVRMGGAVTLNSIIVYVAYNVEKVLLGRFWGADAIGVYGRAYQLVNLPTENLNSAIGGVALSALSRLQDDPPRQRSYFLKGYSLIVALTLPVTVACALFGDDVVSVVLGPKWTEAGVILRLLTPTILVFGLINPTFWLLFSLGLIGRSVRIALVIAPLVIAAYLVGLPYGPRGVALAYSTALTLWLCPHIVWCLRGTSVAPKDLLRCVARPFLSAGVAAAACATFRVTAGASALSAPARLFLGAGLLAGVYAWMLFYGTGQKEFYLELLRGMKRRAPIAAEERATVNTVGGIR